MMQLSKTRVWSVMKALEVLWMVLKVLKIQVQWLLDATSNPAE